MIERIGLDRSSEIRDILEEYLDSLEENQRPPTSFLDEVIDHWENQRVEIQAKLDGSQILGIAVLGLVSNRISIISLTKNAANLDKSQLNAIRAELFESAFMVLKTKEDWVLTNGALVEDGLHEHALHLGFRGFERASMEIDRKTLEAVKEPVIPEGYSFHPFDKTMVETLGKLIYEGNVGNIDVDVFPFFFGTEEDAAKLVENTIENRFGQFRSPEDSRVLKRGEQIVGICLITIRGRLAYIPDICIEPSLRRKGLGRALLVHTLKRAMEANDDLDGVGLDVTLENPAKHLYDSLGFKEQTRYEIFNWLKNWHSQ